MDTAMERVKASSRPLPTLLSRLKFRLAVSSLTTRLKHFWRTLAQHQPSPTGSTSAGAGAGAGVGGGASGVGEVEAPDDLRCLICLDAPGETTVSITDCCHLFCTPCIQSWFEKNTSTSWNISAVAAGGGAPALGASTPCPSCKTNLTRDDIHTVHVGGGGKQGKVEVGGEASIKLLSTWIQQKKGLMVASSPPTSSSASASASLSASSSSLSSASASTSTSSPVSTSPTESVTPDTPPSPPCFDPTPSVRRLRLRGDSSVYGSRLTALLQRIKSLPPNDKLIVATSFSKLRPMVVNALEAEGIKATILGGSPGEMGEAVRVFQNSSPLTLRALVIGAATDCAGLTLTSSNHIFCLDPVVSPAVTAQLIGRIARQGQVKPCFVYHFAALDSLEERMICLRDKIASGDIPLAVQTKALPLARAVVAAASAAGSNARRSKASEEAARAAAVAAVAELGDGNAALLEKIPPQRILYLLRGEAGEVA